MGYSASASPAEESALSGDSVFLFSAAAGGEMESNGPAKFRPRVSSQFVMILRVEVGGDEDIVCGSVCVAAAYCW